MSYDRKTARLVYSKEIHIPIVSSLNKIVKRIVEAAAWFNVLVIFLILITVILRYGFHRNQLLLNWPLVPMEELQWHFYSVPFMFGLAYAIKDMAEKYSNSQLDIEYKTKNIKRYDQDFEIKLHNIIQELVNNTIKHSEASITSIYLEDNDDKIKIYIKDNGKGFDKQSAMKKNGLGINQIDARIHMMKGQFKIESENNSGTSITIELPVVKKESLSFS